MEEKIEFPKSTKEFYNELVARNKLNYMKITKEAVEKLYAFLIDARKHKLTRNRYLAVYGGVEYHNDKDEDERKDARISLGKCPNCNNLLSGTGGSSPTIRSKRIYGSYCLNCGKIYDKEDWRRDVFTETDKPRFWKSNIKY